MNSDNRPDPWFDDITKLELCVIVFLYAFVFGCWLRFPA